MFKVGDRVKSKQFGAGTVCEIFDKDFYTVWVRSDMSKAYYAYDRYGNYCVESYDKEFSKITLLGGN